jgi:hypothetical protein
MRAMPVLLDGQLARQFNLTGQKGKKSFKALLLCQVFLGKNFFTLVILLK